MALPQTTKWLLVALALGVVGVVATLLTRPQVAANPPSEALFTVAPPESALMALESLDFVFRPLFAADRRPPADIEAVASTAETVGQAALKGVTLIGVFASGDAQGVILRRDSGERLRVVEGNSIDGWQLRRVEARAAVFVTGTGEAGLEDRLEMGVMSNLPAPETVPSRGTSGAVGPSAVAADGDDRDTQAGSETAPDSEAAPPATLTFDDIYRQRAAAIQQRRDNSNPPE